MTSPALMPDTPQAQRQVRIAAFLAAAGLAHAERRMLAGDASFRKYERIHDGGKTFVLMDSPPDKEPVGPFVAVARELARLGFSAPRILHADEAAGLLLLEDLGDGLYSRVLARGEAEEQAIYAPAIDVLAALHAAPVAVAPPPYDAGAYARELSLFPDWYLDQHGLSAAARAEYDRLWSGVLAQLDPAAPVLVLRDYHADNLLWLPDRTGTQRVGLLDFQDALLGHRAYDLVSLLEDARRDVAESTRVAMIEAYCEAANVADRGAFLRDYAILGAQRNLKIIGIFHRLNRRDGKPHYLNLIPRVTAHLRRDLQHPALKPVAAFLTSLDAPIAGELA